MKSAGKYPKGPINQHKALATGAPLAKATGNSGQTGFEESGGATKGGTNIPSGRAKGK